ncbi:filamin-c [Anaeramoeba flamelloides]|uniref:Filamin-c n=1 Tax=Anaeramoeba flamelloides TaxID=1746091 RepID=A0AAV7Y5H5_9EUKA|nr:filamin-c [Anaeramoeba flamelloides]
MDHNENGYYAGSVLPECVGSYDVYVKINENFLTQDESPSGGFVIKGGYDIKNCTIEYEKLVFPNSNSYVFFKLLDSNDEKVIVSSSPKLTLELTNISNLKETFRLKKVKNKDAVYGCLLKLSKEGTYSFTVTIDGQLMQEEPFIFTVGHNTTQLTEGKNIHSSVSDLFKIGSSKDIKACFQLLNNQMTAINLKNTGSTPRYLFSKAILKSPQKYRFIFRVEKRASSMCFGIGKFTGNYTESINECYLWDCGNACKIRFGLEEKYGTVVHIGQTVIVQINLKKRYIKFGKEKKLFDVAFSDIPQRCILIVAMFSKKDQITVI